MRVRSAARRGCRSDEYEVTDAGVELVLAWGRTRGDGLVLHAERVRHRQQRAGAVRLSGVTGDPFRLNPRPSHRAWSVWTRPRPSATRIRLGNHANLSVRPTGPNLSPHCAAVQPMQTACQSARYRCLRSAQDTNVSLGNGACRHDAATYPELSEAKGSLPARPPPRLPAVLMSEAPVSHGPGARMLPAPFLP